MNGLIGNLMWPLSDFPLWPHWSLRPLFVTCVSQTFPEPLCFNQTTGGFEVVSLARKELAQQIKAAVRSQRRVPPMYHVVKQHAFRDIPLIPIVPPEGPEKVEIDTAFSVTVRGGIWVTCGLGSSAILGGVILTVTRWHHDQELVGGAMLSS